MRMHFYRLRIILLASLFVISLVFTHLPVSLAEKGLEEEIDPLIVVSLGDSYASGEGIEPFYGQNDGDIKDKAKNESWLAHRSEKSWAGKLYFEGIMPKGKTLNDYNVDAGRASSSDSIQWYFRASSGATTENLDRDLTKGTQEKPVTYMESVTLTRKRARSITPTPTVPNQLSVFSEMNLKGKVDYVTVSIGGNDVQFSNIISKCVTEPASLNGSYELIYKMLEPLWEGISETRSKIKQAYLNIQEAAGPQATIIVTGYPKLLDYQGDGKVISPEEARLVNTAVTKFNYILHGIVEELQDPKGANMNIVFVDIEDIFDGIGENGDGKQHLAYSKEAWINPVYLFETKPEDLNQVFNAASAYSMHPNNTGTDKYALCIQKVLEWHYDSNYHWHQCSGHHVDCERLVDLPLVVKDQQIEKNYYYEGICTDPACKSPHTFGEWIVTKQATSSSPGKRKRGCITCDYEETETIPAISHKHNWSDKWEYDENKHWHICVDCSEKGEYADHKWTQWNTLEEATEFESGKKYRKCKVCGYCDIEETPATPSSEGLEFVDNGDGSCTITGIGTCKDSIVIIPSKIKDLSVTSIGRGAFSWKENIKEIKIPESVVSIGEDAFALCTGLETINIPSKVASLEYGVFQQCYSLTSIEIPSGIKVIGGSAFYKCSSLESVSIMDNVTSIGIYAFAFCKKLKSIIIPKSVTSIDELAFMECDNLSKISVQKGNTVYHSSGNCIIETDTKKLIIGCKTSIIPADGSVTIIGYQSFTYCFGLKSITIPNSVVSVEAAAFAGSGLKSIDIPDSVTHIGYQAFSLTELSYFAVPQKVNCLESYVFCETKLKTLIIPKSVTTIENGAVGDCSELAEIIYSGTVTEWKKIVKASGWDSDSGNYIVKCIDGEIKK